MNGPLNCFVTVSPFFFAKPRLYAGKKRMPRRETPRCFFSVFSASTEAPLVKTIDPLSRASYFLMRQIEK